MTVNWWLIGLAFVLGLVITLAFIVRRVEKGGVAAASGVVASAGEASDGPHGPGSAKPGAGGSGPDGWTVKGNEDSKLYHSTESPSYTQTIAEVWFRDVETAEAAGFNRWDIGKSQRDK